MSEFDAGKSELTDVAKSIGWRDAIARQFGRVDYLTDAGRGIFLDLLPIENADVLEIGDDFGQFTDTIAMRANSVQALEVDPDQADFIREKLRQEQIGNVKVTTGGVDCRLPYEHNSFDLVILNLVFEWCATRLTEPHGEAQERLLREIARVSEARRGHLYLATSNRFALRYILGKTGRTLSWHEIWECAAALVCPRLHRRRSRGRLYSWRGIQNLLERSGFKVKRSWWAAPEMRFPDQMIASDVTSIRHARRRGIRQGEGRAERLAMTIVPARLVKHVAPGLSFLATI